MEDRETTRATKAANQATINADIEPRIPVSASSTPGDERALFRITRAGSYYLTAAVTGVEGKSGIDISAAGITLDLMGFSITGVTGSLDGILTTGEAANVTIRGGAVSGWGRNGLNLAVASDVVCREVAASANGSNGFRCGARAFIVECSAHSNADIGIQAGDGSSILACAAQDNGRYGMLLGRDGAVRDCVARGNHGYGVSAGQGCTITACTATGNETAGLRTEEGSTVAVCTASFNQDAGIMAGQGSSISNCTVSGNSGDGVLAGDGVAVTGCTLQENGGSGIGAHNRTRLTGNLCEGNVGAGIRVSGSDNTIEANSLIVGGIGLEIRAAGNAVAANTVRGNRDNYDIVSGNQLAIVLSQIPESIDWPAAVSLAGSLTGVSGSNGITINSSDVTIDLAGHALIGVSGSLNGIQVTPDGTADRTNVCVGNGAIRGWGQSGVNARDAKNGLFRDLRLLANGKSSAHAGLDCGAGSVVVGCTAMSNGGDGIECGPGSAISGCTAGSNKGTGIIASGIVHTCTSVGNTGLGISLGSGGVVRECVVQTNGSDGITLSDHCSSVGNNCTGNNGAGIRAKPSGQFTRIEANHVTGNKVGIQVESQINLIIRNSAAHNGDFTGTDPATLVNYDIDSGNHAGPVSFGSLDEDSNPHTNYEL
jgi:hypothetical protein